jgi:hypothetical protein
METSNRRPRASGWRTLASDYIPFLQQSLNNGGCCFHRLELFIESFYHLLLLRTDFENQAQLVYYFSEIINEIIVYCLLLLLSLHCIFHLNFVV